MDRKEAIYTLKNTAWLGTNEDREKTEQAVEMAIEALQTQKDGDLISREGATKVIEYRRKTANIDSRIVLDEVEDGIRELPSARAVQGWIPFTRRPMTEEEQKDYPNCTFMFDCVLPDDGDEILVSNRRFVWMDTFCTDIDGCYLDSGDGIDEDMAWMPLPEPYKGGEEE